MTSGNVWRCIGYSLALLVMPVQAETGREMLERFVASTDAWQADFEQDVYNDQEQLIEKASGSFSLLRPGRFRWEYTLPWEQSIVADGKRIWLYDADLEQVTVRSMIGGLSQTPAALLAGDLSALEGVNVLAIAADDGVTRLELSGVDTSSDFEGVVLLFSDTAPIGLELRDRLGQTTRIRFYSARSNPPLVPSDFELQVPDTVDVIDESGL